MTRVASFTDRIEHLAAAVGHGTLTGRVVVDQVYARYQEVREDLRHPRGGQARYLRTALTTGHVDYLHRLAGRAVTRDGSDLAGAMTHNVEDITARQQQFTPILFNNLKRSGHPSVSDGDRVVYDRPPLQRRLTDTELRALRRRRRPGAPRPRRRRR